MSLQDAPRARVGRLVDRARYTLEQGARVAWYSAHYLAARRISKPFDRPGEPQFKPKAPPGGLPRNPQGVPRSLRAGPREH